jgi:putative membrane protein
MPLDPDPAPDPGAGWTRLAPRTVAVRAAAFGGAAVVAGAPTAVGVAARPGGVSPALVLTLALAVIAAGTTHAVLRWRATRYRIGPVRVELRTGVLMRIRRSLPLEAVCSVETDAGPLLRRFGLVVVRIGTGGRGGAQESTIQLWAVTRAEGDRLHDLLLDRIRSAGGPVAEAAHGRLASIDPRWARYAPLSIATPLLGSVLVGAALLAVTAAGIDPRAALPATASWLRTVVAVVVVVAAVLVVGAVAAVLVFCERWWNFRLDREPGGLLRVRRGLVVVRSVALEEQRLQGVVIVEPLGCRLLGAARLRAVGTGQAARFDDEAACGATVLPAAPRPLAHRVAAVVLGERLSPTAAVLLSRHPDSARQRRELRATTVAIVPVLLLAGAAVVTGSAGLLVAAAAAAATVVPAAVLLARDSYRNLGHGLVGGYLVTRSGVLRRRTVAMRCDAVTGWRATCTRRQRRDGLITLSAITAAGAEAVSAPDITESDGLRLAATAAPDLMLPFLVTETQREAAGR